MKITFVLPGIGLPGVGFSGGVKVVFELANHLQERGHSVSVVYPFVHIRPGLDWYNLRKLSSRVKGVFMSFSKGDRVDWFDLKAKLIRFPILAERYIPDADIIVATWWETAYWVAKYSKNKGEKFYLIQGYEIWGGPKEKVHKTYKLGLHNIVISSWLKKILENLQAEVEAVILDGVNFEEFYPENVKRDDNEIRILMPYREQECKGVKDGLEVLKIVQRKCKNIKLVMFGPKPRRNELPSNAEFHFFPVKDELRKLYDSCDIFVFPSRCEGFGLPPMEAMACKLAVATTNVGAIPDYTIPGKTALVSPPGDVFRMSQNVIKLIENKRLREQIAQNGYDYVKQFTWERATDQLEKLFLKYNPNRK